MNKKLVTLAVGAALGLPMAAAQAKVTVYGHAQIEVGNQEIDRPGIANDSDNNFVTDNARGRLGVKAAEKLGNGMTALAKFEWRINTDEGGAPRTAGANRESFVGLKGTFGTIELGALKTPYKYFGGVSYDPFVATTLEARGNGGMTGGSSAKANFGDSSFGHNAFAENSIGYKSPNYSGFSFWGVYSPDEQDENTGGAAVANDDYFVGAKYKNGPFEIGSVVMQNSSTAAGGVGVEAESIKYFGKYKIGNHTILAQFEDSEYDPNTTVAGNNVDLETWFVGYQLRAGNNTFVVQAGNQDRSGGATGERDYYTVGMIHHLSKKTRLFGGYRNTEDSADNSETDVWSVGLRVLF